jgi:hypothetical protein
MVDRSADAGLAVANLSALDAIIATWLPALRASRVDAVTEVQNGLGDADDREPGAGGRRVLRLNSLAERITPGR